MCISEFAETHFVYKHMLGKVLWGATPVHRCSFQNINGILSMFREPVYRLGVLLQSEQKDYVIYQHEQVAPPKL